MKEKETKTKICKYCKTEIASDAKICPNCRKKQKSGMKPVIIAVIALGLLGACFSGGGSDEKETKAIVEQTEGKRAEETGAEASAVTETEKAAETQEATLKSETETIEEQVLLEWSGVKVTAKELVKDSFWGKGIKVLIENDSDKNLGISCNALIVNNYMITDLFSESVAAGKKNNSNIYLSSEQLDAAGIDTIGEIEIYFHIFDGDTYSTLYDSDKVVIQTSQYENMDTKINDGGKELVNQNGVRIVGKYVDENSFWGKAVLLYIENTSGKNIGVNCDNMSINGFMVTPLFSSTVYDGKMALDDIALLSSELENNGIEEIKDIELTFHVYNADTYTTLFDSEVVSFTVE